MALASAPSLAKEKSLYKRLGGKTAIVAVVDEFVGRSAPDVFQELLVTSTAGTHRRGAVQAYAAGPTRVASTC